MFHQKTSSILVKFLSGRRKTVNFKYVCVIQSVLNGSEYEVMALKSMNTHKFVFSPRNDDISVVTMSDIIAVLPDPCLVQSGDRIRYHFNFSVDVKKI